MNLRVLVDRLCEKLGHVSLLAQLQCLSLNLYQPPFELGCIQVLPKSSNESS